MTPQRRQVRNRSYLPGRYNANSPYHPSNIQNPGYHPALAKRWNLFHHATEAPVNASSSPSPSPPSTPTTPEHPQNVTNTSSSEKSLNTSTSAPLTPANEDYNILNIQSRDVPPWQVPEDSNLQDPLPLHENYGMSELDSPDDHQQNLDIDENKNFKNSMMTSSLDSSSKFKRGFRLLPVSNNLYVLKQDPEISELPNTNDNQKTGDLKRSNPQFDDGTADLLSFKAHMHHRVEDIGKTFLNKEMKKDVLSSGSESIGDSLESLDSDGFRGTVGESSALGQYLENPSIGLGLNQPVDALESQDPLLSPLESDPENVKMYENPYASVDSPGSYSGFDPYQPHPLLTKSLYPSDPNYQSNFYPPPANRWPESYLNPPGLNSFDDINQPYLAETYNNIMTNSADDLDRGPRGDPEDGHLGYLDNYARAVNSINNHWNLAQEASDGADSPPADTIRETLVPVNDQAVTSEAPRPEEDPAKTNGTSLAMVIEPLTAQLQKLLSSIQQVNERLMSDQENHEAPSGLDSLRRKRGAEKTSAPADEFYDDLDDDSDDEEDVREERSDDDYQDESVSSCPPGLSRTGKRCSLQKEEYLRPAKNDEKFGPSPEDSQKDSVNTSRPSGIQKSKKESNSSIMSFLQKTFGTEKDQSTQVPSRITWKSMGLTTDLEETTVDTAYREHFVNPGFLNDVGEAVGAQSTLIVSHETTQPPITFRVPLYPEEEQTRPPEVQEIFKSSPEVTIPPVTSPKPSGTTKENTQNVPAVQVTQGIPGIDRKMPGGLNYDSMKSLESSADIKGQVDSTVPPAGDLETMKVAIEPLPGSPNDNGSLSTQLLRTNSKDLLIKLLSPEIIQNITDTGIIVRVPGEANLKRTESSTFSSSKSTDTVQGNSLWLFEGQGHINQPQDKKAVESRSDGDVRDKSGGSDAMVAVGDDDEEAGDTKLTIRLRLPARSHPSAHSIQKAVRSIDDRLNQKGGDLVQKTLTKRSEPVEYPDEEYEEDYQNLEKRNIDKRGNDYLDDFEEDEAEFEDYDDEQPEEDYKNEVKRSGETSGVNQSSQGNVPKIVLRLKFPESSEAASDVMKRSSSRDKEKKKQQVMKKSPKPNTRIGRSLKWVMEEPGEREGRFSREADVLNNPNMMRDASTAQEEFATAPVEATAYRHLVEMMKDVTDSGSQSTSSIEVFTSGEFSKTSSGEDLNGESSSSESTSSTTEGEVTSPAETTEEFSTTTEVLGTSTEVSSISETSASTTADSGLTVSTSEASTTLQMELTHSKPLKGTTSGKKTSPPETSSLSTSTDEETTSESISASSTDVSSTESSSTELSSTLSALPGEGVTNEKLSNNLFLTSKIPKDVMEELELMSTGEKKIGNRWLSSTSETTTLSTIRQTLSDFFSTLTKTTLTSTESFLGNGSSEDQRTSEFMASSTNEDLESTLSGNKSASETTEEVSPTEKISPFVKIKTSRKNSRISTTSLQTPEYTDDVSVEGNISESSSTSLKDESAASEGGIQHKGKKGQPPASRIKPTSPSAPNSNVPSEDSETSEYSSTETSTEENISLETSRSASILSGKAKQHHSTSDFLPEYTTREILSSIEGQRTSELTEETTAVTDGTTEASSTNISGEMSYTTESSTLTELSTPEVDLTGGTSESAASSSSSGAQMTRIKTPPSGKLKSSSKLFQSPTSEVPSESSETESSPSAEEESSSSTFGSSASSEVHSSAEPESTSEYSSELTSVTISPGTEESTSTSEVSVELGSTEGTSSAPKEVTTQGNAFVTSISTELEEEEMSSSEGISTVTKVLQLLPKKSTPSTSNKILKSTGTSEDTAASPESPASPSLPKFHKKISKLPQSTEETPEPSERSSGSLESHKKTSKKNTAFTEEMSDSTLTSTSLGGISTSPMPSEEFSSTTSEKVRTIIEFTRTTVSESTSEFPTESSTRVEKTTSTQVSHPSSSVPEVTLMSTITPYTTSSTEETEDTSSNISGIEELSSTQSFEAKEKVEITSEQTSESSSTSTESGEWETEFFFSETPAEFEVPTSTEEDIFEDYEDTSTTGEEKQTKESISSSSSSKKSSIFGSSTSSTTAKLEKTKRPQQIAEETSNFQGMTELASTSLNEMTPSITEVSSSSSDLSKESTEVWSSPSIETSEATMDMTVSLPPEETVNFTGSEEMASTSFNETTSVPEKSTETSAEESPSSEEPSESEFTSSTGNMESSTTGKSLETSIKLKSSSVPSSLPISEVSSESTEAWSSSSSEPSEVTGETMENSSNETPEETANFTESVELSSTSSWSESSSSVTEVSAETSIEHFTSSPEMWESGSTSPATATSELLTTIKAFETTEKSIFSSVTFSSPTSEGSTESTNVGSSSSAATSGLTEEITTIISVQTSEEMSNFTRSLPSSSTTSSFETSVSTAEQSNQTSTEGLTSAEETVASVSSSSTTKGEILKSQTASTEPGSEEITETIIPETPEEPMHSTGSSETTSIPSTVGVSISTLSTEESMPTSTEEVSSSEEAFSSEEASEVGSTSSSAQSKPMKTTKAPKIPEKSTSSFLPSSGSTILAENETTSEVTTPETSEGFTTVTERLSSSMISLSSETVMSTSGELFQTPTSQFTLREETSESAPSYLSTTSSSSISDISPKSEQIDTLFPTLQTISSPPATSIITEEKFDLETWSPTEPSHVEKTTHEQLTTEKTEIEDYESEIETETGLPEEYGSEEESGSGQLTDFFEYTDEGLTQPWGTSSSQTTAPPTSEQSTQSSPTTESVQSSQIVVEVSEALPTTPGGLLASSEPPPKTSEILTPPASTSELFPSSETTPETLTTLESSSGISQTTSEFFTTPGTTPELIHRPESTQETPTTSKSSSEVSPTTSKFFITTLPTSELSQNVETTLEVLTTPELSSQTWETSTSSYSTPEISTSPFPWETPESTEQLTSIITEYESTPFITTLAHEEGITERTTQVFTLGDTEGIELTESLPDFEEGSTTPGFGEKEIKVESTTEFVMNITMPTFLERPEEPSEDYDEEFSVPEVETTLSFASSMETVIPQDFSTESESAVRTPSQELEASTKFGPGTEIIVSSVFPSESTKPLATVEDFFSVETTTSGFMEDTQSASSIEPLETSSEEGLFISSEEPMSMITFAEPTSGISSVSSTEEYETSSSRFLETLVTASHKLSSLFPMFSSASASTITEEETSHGEITENTREEASERTEEESSSEETSESTVEESSPEDTSGNTEEEESHEEEVPKTPETPMNDEDQLKNAEREQLERRRKLEQKMKDLEEKEKALLEREAELRRRQEEWEREKLRRQQEKERLEEEKRQKMLTTIRTTTTTTEIPTTTIDYEKLKELEEMRQKQAELEDELDQMEKDIDQKEQELEEREKALEEEEKKHEQERKEFEDMWNEEKELEEKEKELKDKEKKLLEKSSSTPNEFSTTGEESASTVKFSSTEGSSSSDGLETSLPRGEGDEQADVSSGDYVFDENEEVWKERPPSDTERKSEEEYAGGCSSPEPPDAPESRVPENDEVESEKKAVPEESKRLTESPDAFTKKYCLHVLDEAIDPRKIDTDKYVTEVMCMPNFKQLRKQRKRAQNRNAQRRRLMSIQQSATIPVDIEFKVKKRSKDIIHDLKIKPIASLDLMHDEWLHNDTTMRLHTPVGFTRVYESWSRVPIEPFTFMEDFTRKGFPVRDETFMRSNFKVNKFDQRIQPTQVNRLTNDEWVEVPVERDRLTDKSAPDEDEEQDEEGDNKEESGTRNEKEDQGMRKRKVRGDDEDDDSGVPTEFPPEYEENCLLQQQERLQNERSDLEDEEEDRNDEEQVFVEPEENSGGDNGNEGAVDVEDGNDESTISPPDNGDDSEDAISENLSENNGGTTEGFESNREPDDHEKNISEDNYNEKESEDLDNAHSNGSESTGVISGTSPLPAPEITSSPILSLTTSEPSLPMSSSKASHQSQTTPSLPLTTEGDYGDVEYVTDDSLEPPEDYPDQEEDIPENGWEDYVDESESKGDMKKRERTLRSSLQSLINTKKMLMDKKKSLLRRENLLKQKENILKQSEAGLEHLKAKRSRRKTRKTRKQVTSWPTEGTGRYHLGGFEKWQSGLLEDVPQEFRKNKQTFTVNVLQLDYDEEEENHKLKCNEPDKSDLIINQGLVTKKIEDTTLKGTSVNAEHVTNDYKLRYDPNAEAEVIANEKSSGTPGADGDLAKGRKQSKKTTRSRKPPGTQWPTEMTTVFHVGGTKFWDKERTAIPDDNSFRRRNVRGLNYYENNEEGETLDDGDEREEYADDVGTTCMRLLLRKEDAKMWGQKRDAEEQIQAPEDDYYDDLMPLKPKLRTIKSITQLSADEAPKDVERNSKKVRRSEDTGVLLDSPELMTLPEYQEAVKLEDVPIQSKAPGLDVKNLPVLIKVNNTKVIRMTNFDRPPKELYVMYRCGPPEVVAVFDPNTDLPEVGKLDLPAIPPTPASQVLNSQNRRENYKLKYKTIFPFDRAQLSEVTASPISAHIHGEVNPSSGLSKRHSRKKKKRRKGRRKDHKRRKKPRNPWRRRQTFSLSEDLPPGNLLNTSHQVSSTPHERFGRSLLSLQGSKRRAKVLKHHKKSHHPRKPKPKGQKTKKVHKRETLPSVHNPQGSSQPQGTPQMINNVLGIVKPPNPNLPHKSKSPRSILDKMKQVINNVMGNDSSHTPEPNVNINPDEEEADDGYTEIVHQSAARFMPTEDVSPSHHHSGRRHHRKKHRHHQAAHSPHHHSHSYQHHHQHHHEHEPNHAKSHSKFHHKSESHSHLSRETGHGESSESRRDDDHKSSSPKVSFTKHKPSASRDVLKPVRVTQNGQKPLNISGIIPTVKNLVENQNLGSLEKIIVYVDKTEGLRKKKRRTDKFPVKMTVEQPEKKKRGAKRSKSPNKSNLEEVSFDGESLDEMISHVADKILTSVSGSSLHDLDPHLSVKVIQEVPDGAGEAHEETKSEFSINLLDTNIKKPEQSRKKSSRSSKTSSSARLTSVSSQRKMNLKGTAGKKRNLWKSKIKRESIIEEITKKLEKELRKKLSRTRRRVSVESVEDSGKPLPHHLDDLDEKIRILYGMHHRKDAKGGGINKKKKRRQKNHKRSKREDDWRLDHLDSNIFATENDKKSLRGLIEQIINLQKNVNTTLQIIRKRLDESPDIIARNLTRRMITNSSSGKSKRQPHKKSQKQNPKKDKGKKKSSKTKTTKKPTPKPERKTDKPKKKTHQKTKAPGSKKKLDISYGDAQIDKIGNEIQEILKEEGEGKMSNKKKKTNRRKSRTLKEIPEDDWDTLKIGRHLCSKDIHDQKRKSVRKTSKSSSKKSHLTQKKKSNAKKSTSTSKKVNRNSKRIVEHENKNIGQVIHANSSLNPHTSIGNALLTGHFGSNRSDNCEGCLCDLEDVVSNLRKMLLMRNDLLDRISTYSCQKFIRIGDELILTSSGVLGDVLPRSRRQIAEAKGLKYIKPGDLEDLLQGDEVRDHEHEILSFPGSDLNIPCNREGEEITWVMSISRPNYTWTRVDSSPISGTIRKNGNLELYDVDAKDAGNYSCIVTYIDPDNEELVENIYQHTIQIVTLPRYSLRGGNRYKMEICEEPELDILSVYLPSKLNEVLCKNSICDAFIFAPHCHSHQVSIRVLVVPTNPSKLFPISSSQCGLRCRKAVQDKLAFLLSQNLRIILRKTIVFRLPNRLQDKLVPIESRLVDFEGARGRRAYDRAKRKDRGDADGEVGLLVGCPAGYGLDNSHCVPCSPHYHSQDLSARCKRCPLGTHQPSIGSRVCRSCTNPFVDGCYDMLWTTSSILLTLLASLVAVILVCLIVLWTVCCGKRRKPENFLTNETEKSIKEPLIPPLDSQSDLEELLWERPRKKKKKLVKRFLRAKDEDQPLVYGINLLPKKKTEKGREKVKTIPVCCIDSYRSHGGHCPECKHPYVTNHGTRKAHGRPPVPFPDFDR
ncbi:uncharacterized protein LOC135167066 [Diachasmimorpha longicaudata]|uniref:uncharacterized protein LOC135167066 n=1 Tax=Diachasmimorpha longicaudata TaxID=58733 RepID=UPI0030B8AC49